LDAELPSVKPARRALRALVFGDLKLGDAPATIAGDTRLARAFLRLFARP
jgi:orotidine-5'-phosphate decarboxylase